MEQHNLNILIHELCGVILCLFLFFHRAIPFDYSSFWQIGILCMLYLMSRLLKMEVILKGIVAWSSIESLFAIFQKFGYIGSNHPMFDVTGSFNNPGPLGGLLAIGLLINASLFLKEFRTKSYRRATIYVAISVLILNVLLITQSRAGWLAFGVGGLFLLLPYVKRYLLKKRFFLCCTVLIILSILFLTIAYLLKKDSADGRLLIWINTWYMVLDYPLLGLGTGGWQSNYMHYQADYFLHHPDSSFLMLADNVAYPYNEYLLLLAEQGFIGFFCLLFFLGGILLFKENGKLGKALLLSFMTFAFFSYPSNVFSLQILFVVLVGMMKSRSMWQCPISFVSTFRIGIGLLMALLTLTSIHSVYIYHRIYENLQTLIEGKNMGESLRLLDESLPYFRHNRKLMYFYAMACVERQIAEERFLILKETSHLFPTSDLYCDMGDVWKRKRDIIQAERYYRIAMNLVPSRLAPKYKLFLLYREFGKRKEALKLKEHILATPLKKESTKELRIKGEVKAYL